MERNTNQHVGEERLEAYAMQSMDQEEVAVVEEHLLVCVTCQDQLDAVEHYLRAMKGAAKRIRDEEAAAPVKPGAWAGIRKWLHTPAPIWTAGLAMAGVMLVVGLQFSHHPGPPVDVELQAIRGASSGVARAGHALHLRLDSRGVPASPAWRIEIVDDEGSRVWMGSGSWSDTAIQAAVDKSFKPGTYFVRLLKEGDDPVREYQLIIQR